MYELIASPFLNTYIVVRPGSPSGLKIPYLRYLELKQAAETDKDCPTWLVEPSRRAWNLDLNRRPASCTILVRAPSQYGYGRASYEINKGCNFACEHCYLGLKEFQGLAWDDKVRLLHILRDAGVLWLQLTGGEPMIDKHFPDAYALAFELGMVVEILTNGSRLAHPKVLDLLLRQRPGKVTVSVYGATADSFDSLTQRKGAFRLVTRGMDAAREAGIPLELALIVTKHNAHEIGQMRALAERYGARSKEYTNISPTYFGTGETLAAQAPGYLNKNEIFKGCPAGHTFFHVDPLGIASICKVGRDQQIPLMAEGVAGLSRLGGIADSLMLRTGGCSGCQLSGTCRVCRPLAKVYQEAKAPLERYCQHSETRS
ncbi:radical SAM protein [Streptantibioticus rubrisoli]|uniref:Radical SAM protein n=1 Tax=Streptantibioticus rubrisoli TaxID=1387313 RepID=A0ABT1PLS8_9ACTN|nr:radical SAM protein [Streptantibioticus rubrisoli]MCQ4045766.1 radical SAM protein [Streptantibioticus rubrisoli]